MGILVSFQTGVSTTLSAPALNRWMSLMFFRNLISDGRTANVTSIVASKNSSGTIVSEDNVSRWRGGKYRLGHREVPRRIPAGSLG